jgi:signal transduction histidine kinase
LPTDKSQLAGLGPIREPILDDRLKKEREFVSITVHELKAPLSITKWSLEVLKSGRTGELNHGQRELIDQVERGNERLLVLVRDLLNLAKLQEGKFSIDKKPTDISRIVGDVVTGFGPEAEKRKLSLVWQKPKNPLPKAAADASRIAQVITNLVSNALKYTPEKGKVIVNFSRVSAAQIKSISCRSAAGRLVNTDNKKGYLVFSVKDNGMGISAEDQKNLFSKFFRSQKVLGTSTEGTGLGLYITKTIVDLHGGDIWFTSAAGQGSTFYFSLPIS